MVRIPKYTTFCTVCHRQVGVRPSWVRQQSGQGDEWKVTRHRSTEQRANNRGLPETICTGSGIVVSDDVVFPTRDDDYSEAAYNRTVDADS